MEILLKNFKLIILSLTGVILIVVVVKNYVKIKTFLLEVKSELGKVAWSTRQELMGSTIVVIATTAIIALFIGIIDISLSKLLSLLFK